MTFIITFTALSFTASALVISACALSSRLTHREGVDECYSEYSEPVTVTTNSVTHFSAN